MKAKINAEAISRLGKQISDATILMHEAIARKAGLTAADRKYLGIILDNGSLTAGELSNLTGLTTGAITGLIDRLEKKKLVKREFDKSDRRKVFIVPNIDKASRLFANSHLDLPTQLEHLLSTFTAKEIQVIERYLTSTVEIMNNVTKRLNEK
jgi:DNA-binding MarR family transcriptional regulator